MGFKLVLILWIAIVEGALEQDIKTSTAIIFNKGGLASETKARRQPCIGEIGDILENIRSLMHNANYSDTPLQAYIVLMNDAHQSEYISDRDKRIQYISKFTGSSGSAVITETQAVLWTDSRYHLQAELEIDSKCWMLMKTGQEKVPSLSEWFNLNLPPKSTVGIDPFVISSTQYKSIQDELNSGGHQHQLISLERNLVDDVWLDRPEPSHNEIVPYRMKFSGKSAGMKINEVRQKLREDNASGIIVTALDDIAWILNLRGSDIQYNPVFFSYLILTHKILMFFVDERKLLNDSLLQLTAEKVDFQLRNYEDISLGIEEMVNNTLGPIMISSDASQAIYRKIPSGRRRVVSNIIADMKAVKNSVEAEGLEQAHIRDGYAVVRYLHWLDATIDMQNVTEISGAEKLSQFRRQLENYRGPSFETISCVGPHAAMAHFSPTPETATQITRDEIYLVDSGGQYWDGTTDITRTVHFGDPTSEEVECFTRVLKGFIALATSVFPRKTQMRYLDYVARRALWQAGLNYGHGTGHGVGAYLLVHEYPPLINSGSDKILHKNMFTSNEPGYYKDGEFGIRIEDVVQVIEADIENAFDGLGALTFKSITYVPLQTKMIDRKLITNEEVTFINEYNQRIFEVIGSKLLQNNLKETYEWLEEETREISL
ncbi:XPNPEP1.2 family protein [Megaselia abdita]